ncbi:MAG: ACP S-malonyltransferase [bacterium]|nr:ACP S-malonyltransferase [bacterium]
MKKTAFIFPGQGSQFVGMGKDFYNNFSVAKKVYDKADSVLGRKISSVCFESTEDELRKTINTQPAIVTTSIAILETLKQYGIKADYTAGHSLGEYCAMYNAGVMNLEDTLISIQKRAELMNTVNCGSMTAVLNASEEQLKMGLAEGRKVGYLDIANYNSPTQVVITGDNEAVKAAGDYMLANGVKRVVPLAVSGAFHSKYVKNAGEEFKEFIKNIKLNNAQIPVITNVDAETTTMAEDFRDKMPRQIYSSVHWTQTIQRMASDGVDTFVEIGPGKVLTNLNKRIAPNAFAYSINNTESLQSTINALKTQMSEELYQNCK